MVSKANLVMDKDSARIDGDIDFSNVVELRNQGAQWLKGSAPQKSCFDFSGVQACNSAATALLLDWLRTAKEVNKEITIENVPHRLRALMQLAELEDVLAEEIS